METIKDEFTLEEARFQIPETISMPQILRSGIDEFEASGLIAEFFVATQEKKASAARYLDSEEIAQIRCEYQLILETVLPDLEQQLIEREEELNAAKKAHIDMKKLIEANLVQVRTMAEDAKMGVTEIELDPQFTWRIPADGKYYYYTLVDDALTLCKVVDIPEEEINDLLNVMNNNWRNAKTI